MQPRVMLPNFAQTKKLNICITQLYSSLSTYEMERRLSHRTRSSDSPRFISLLHMRSADVMYLQHLQQLSLNDYNSAY